MSQNPTNPKVDLPRRRYNSSGLDGLDDPIKDEVVDTQLVRDTYSQLPIIPFFDNSDATLRFFRKLRYLSPTAEACTNRITNYVVGGGLRTAIRRTPGFYKPIGGAEVEVTKEQDELYREFVNGLNPVDDADKLLGEIEQLADNTLTYGNNWLCLRLTDVAGERHAYLDAKDSEHVRYWATLPGEPQVAVISKSWDFAYIQKYPPEFIGVYPNFTTDPATGDQLTLFHGRERSLTREWYGVPRNMGSLYWKYLEGAFAEFSVRGYKNRWTADVIIETSGDEVDKEDPKDFQDALRKMFTNEGEALRFIHRHKLATDQPMTVTQLKSDTSHEFHDTMSTIAFHKIVQAYDWHTVLLSEQTPGKLGFSKEFLDIYRVKFTSVIKPRQDQVLTVVNKALSEAAAWMNRTDVAGLSLGLCDMLEGLDEQGDEIVDETAADDAAESGDALSGNENIDQ